MASQIALNKTRENERYAIERLSALLSSLGDARSTIDTACANIKETISVLNDSVESETIDDDAPESTGDRWSSSKYGAFEHDMSVRDVGTYSVNAERNVFNLVESLQKLTHINHLTRILGDY